MFEDVRVRSFRKDKQLRGQLQPPAAISEALAYAFDEYQEPSDEGTESADDAAQSELPPSRKRVAKPETWKRNNRPKKVKVVEKPPCGCGLRCFVTFGRAQRKRIREAFATLPRAEQKAYMKELIDLKRPASKGRPALQICRKQPRKFSATYHLKDGQARVVVCFKAFIAVLGVGAFQVKALNRKVWATPNASVASDARGKHGQQLKTPAATVRRVQRHIKAFPRKQSHYALGSTHQKCLAADLSVRKMQQWMMADMLVMRLPT